MLHFVFCDGAVHTVSYKIDPEIHRCLSNRTESEKVDQSDFAKWIDQR